MDFLQQLQENSQRYSQRELLADGHGNTLTYGETYELSGRVYAYLKAQGIGAEDFVLINLPHGIYPFAAFCGVLRAGAAFVIVEDTMPLERIEYIRGDCGCKLVIDQACWQAIMQMQPLEGYEPRTDHGAAFAVYTSGTTGAPKGVLHEYGNIARMIASSPLPAGEAVARFVLCSPLNFVLSLLAAFVLISQATTLIYVVPFATLKDPLQFHAFLLENGITFAFLSPLFVKKMAPLLKSLVFCVVGAEPANDLFSEDFTILNGYSMSEVGFVIASFLIDKPYTNTPVGNPVFDCPIRLLGDDGEEVPAGEKGEIVVANPYVRGYMNLPEKTVAAFKDGWYHTGDLGKWDEQNHLVVCGRLDDMDKVNGNRIEPGEIEAVAREVLHLSWAAAKTFHDDDRCAVCLYYTDDVEIDADAARQQMAERLPHYMLPAFFMHIDQVPLTAAGKFNRKALKAPRLESMRAAYCAPENQAQAALCEAFSKVFNISTVGILDDFFQLGGDSVDAMEVVVSTGLEGLTVADILTGRTPQGIASLYAEHAGQENADQVNEQAFLQDYPLTANQAYTVEWQLKEPDSVMRSIHTLMKFNNQVISMDRMAAALATAAKNHPALMTEIYRAEDGELRQRFTPSLLGDIRVEHLTEAEFAQVKEGLVQPFTMIGVPLFRARVFETEAAGYVFVDVHHTVFDGSSYGVLISDILAAYMGKELQKDYYPYILATQGCCAGSAAYEENKAYFESAYAGTDWCQHLTATGGAINGTIAVRKTSLPVTLQQLEQVEKLRGISKNSFFALAAALATAQCEHARNVMLFWTFNGRTDARELRSVGNLRCSLPLAFTFEDDTTLEQLCASVNNQVNGGIAHCRYAYLEQNPAILDEGVIRVLYQGTMGATPKMPGLLGSIPLAQTNQTSRAFVNLEIAETASGPELTLKYTANSYDQQRMDAFLARFTNAVKVLADAAANGEASCASLLQALKQ